MDEGLFRNILLEGLIKKHYSSARKFCLALDIRPPDVCQLLNLKASPVLKNGKYRPICQGIADHFFMEVGDIFPLELYNPEEDGLSEDPVELVPLDERSESLRLDADSGNDELELSELRHYLETALDCLNKQQKAVFLLHEVLGYTLEEIGESFGNLTKQRICEIRKTLIGRLEHHSHSKKLKEFR